MEPLKKISLVALIPLVVSLIAVYNGMKMFMKVYILISSQLLVFAKVHISTHCDVASFYAPLPPAVANNLSRK